MKPQVYKKSEIKKAKYKVSWYKSMVKLLRNNKTKDHRNNATILLS